MPIKKPRIKNWEFTQELVPMLLFAQVLEEKLFDFTLDSYKARALNTHTAVYELHEVATQVKNGSLKSGNLIPIIEEFENLIKTDPVLTSSEKEIFQEYCQRLDRFRNRSEDLLSVIDALAAELGGFYWKRLLAAISNEVRNSGNSNLLVSLAEAFITEAELQGFHRGYVYFLVKKFFWRSEITSVDVIDNFLNYFLVEESKYTFILRGSKAFLDLAEFAPNLTVEILEKAPEIELSHIQATDFLDENKEYPVYLVIRDIKAKDRVRARLRAEYRIEAVANVYTFNIHHEDLRWRALGMCLSGENNFEGLIKPPLSPMKRCINSSVQEKSNDIRHMFEVVGGIHFGYPGMRLFFKALDYHRAAVNAETSENQLVDLWAALEGFLPKPDPESSRVSHFVSVLLPSLTLTYPEKLFNYVTASLGSAGSDISQFVQDTSPDVDLLEACICLLVSNDQEERRKELYAKLETNPLLRNRCFLLNEQFRSSKRSHKTISAHRERVSWHIQRIYSTRNQIVHSAESLPYLGTLVESLHSYIDTLIKSITTVGVQAMSETSVEGSIKLLSVHEQLYLRRLETQDIRCDCENYKDIIFGINNPLSPFHDELSLCSS